MMSKEEVKARVEERLTLLDLPDKVREVFKVIKYLPHEMQVTVICGVIEELALKEGITAKELFSNLAIIAEVVEKDCGPYKGGLS